MPEADPNNGLGGVGAVGVVGATEGAGAAAGAPKEKPILGGSAGLVPPKLKVD